MPVLDSKMALAIEPPVMVAPPVPSCRRREVPQGQCQTRWPPLPAPEPRDSAAPVTALHGRPLRSLLLSPASRLFTYPLCLQAHHGHAKGRAVAISGGFLGTKIRARPGGISKVGRPNQTLQIWRTHLYSKRGARVLRGYKPSHFVARWTGTVP